MRAKELIFTGRVISAEEAHAIGIAGRRATTITMNVSYIAPAASWNLVAEGRCTRSGGIAFAEVEVKSGDGELVATGSVTFKTRRRTPP